ncbi:MAG: thermonuclease family protein [Polyangiaceae bacterium]
MPPLLRGSFWLSTLAFACSAPGECGPASAEVSRVIDGDTIELVGGERVRYLLVDTPEISGAEPACYGLEAQRENRKLVEGRRVGLRYSAPCRDRYSRLLAYVSVDDIDVNVWLISGGYACLLHIPPAGDERAPEFQRLQQEARDDQRGLWGTCPRVPCG